MTEDQAYKIIDHFENWNKGQTASHERMQPLIDAKRGALIAAYNTLANLKSPDVRSSSDGNS